MPQPWSTGILAEALQQQRLSSMALQEHNSPSNPFVCRTIYLTKPLDVAYHFYSRSSIWFCFGVFFRPSWTEKILIFSIKLQRKVLYKILRYCCYFSHTDSKTIIPSLISILWTVCSFEHVFCFLSYFI